jgi:hypothetical protein
LAAPPAIGYHWRMMSRRNLLLIAVIAVALLAGCRSQRNATPVPVPTLASLDMLATAQPLTQNAPPPPFDSEQTRYVRIDDGLNQLAGARTVVQLEFDGTYTETGQQVSASAQAEITLDQLTSARRVVLTTEGSLIGQPDDTQFEAVRLGEDAYLVRDGVCAGGADAQAAASLSAVNLLGGVLRAAPAGRQAVINGEQVYAYAVAPEDLSLPSVQVSDGGRLQVDSAELWISPARGVVVRFYVNLTVENAIVFDRPSPVTGTVLLRYDAYDLDQANTISIPFGC